MNRVFMTGTLAERPAISHGPDSPTATLQLNTNDPDGPATHTIIVRKAAAVLSLLSTSAQDIVQIEGWLSNTGSAGTSRVIVDDLYGHFELVHRHSDTAQAPAMPASQHAYQADRFPADDPPFAAPRKPTSGLASPSGPPTEAMEPEERPPSAAYKVPPPGERPLIKIA